MEPEIYTIINSVFCTLLGMVVGGVIMFKIAVKVIKNKQ